MTIEKKTHTVLELNLEESSLRVFEATVLRAI
jgi:hypothetical protein